MANPALDRVQTRSMAADEKKGDLSADRQLQIVLKELDDVKKQVAALRKENQDLKAKQEPRGDLTSLMAGASVPPVGDDPGDQTTNGALGDQDVTHQDAAHPAAGPAAAAATRGRTRDAPRIKTRGDMKYSGSTPFSTYLRRFQLIAECNEWSALERYGNLIQNLAGAAEEEFAESGASTFPAVCSVLQRAFPEEDGQTVMNKLGQRVQEKDESLIEFQRAIKRLVFKAHTHADEETRDEIGRQHFINGLRDARIRRKLRESDILGFDQVVRKAVNLEACQETEKDALKSRAKVVTESVTHEAEEGAWGPAFVKQVTEELEGIRKQLNKRPHNSKGRGKPQKTPKKSILCYYCQQPGHMIRECPYRQAGLCPPVMTHMTQAMPVQQPVYQGNGRGQVSGQGVIPALPHNLSQSQ